MAIRKGSKVSHSVHGGLWKVIDRENPNNVFKGCARYTLRNVHTREFIMGVRDKDIITMDHPLFAQFLTLGD